MHRDFITRFFLLSFLLVSACRAAENGDVTGRIVDVQQKVHTRVLYYVVDTPITRDDPYFEVSVQIKDKVYTGEHTPRHVADTLPADWKAEAEVRVRLEKHTMFLKRPNGEEMEFIITRHTAAPAPPPLPARAAPIPK
jgi:hypothetical protein